MSISREAYEAIVQDCLDAKLKAEKLEAQLAEREWVSVDEGLPNFDEHILLCDTNGELLSGKLVRVEIPRGDGEHDEDLIWVDTSGFIECEFEKVTHWMPLPEPPKNGGRDE